MKKQFHLTKEGVQELKAEVAVLTAQRAEIAERIKTARDFGDLRENSEYSAARTEQEQTESRIAEIENILQNVKIITKPKGDNKVQLGSSVKLKDESGKVQEFQVVGTVEADPLNGKISDESPIGQALIGKKVGETVTIQTPTEPVDYTLASIG